MGKAYLTPTSDHELTRCSNTGQCTHVLHANYPCYDSVSELTLSLHELPHPTPPSRSNNHKTDKSVLQQPPTFSQNPSVSRTPNMTILIIGGTGRLGFSVAKALQSIGQSVLITSRRAKPESSSSPFKDFHIAQFDWHDRSTFMKPFNYILYHRDELDEQIDRKSVV